ncbi:MAG: hypothetical protein OEM41_01980, partial [Ignavibacteria bacterium]|nr:hypothetical protein [Ignavibacteria bacterium]
MKKFTFVLAMLFLVTSTGAYAQLRQTFVKYEDTGYRYLVAKKNDKVLNQFYASNFIDTAWPVGDAAVGTLNNTSSPPCPLNDATHIKIFWPSSREVLLRKHVNLPAGTRNVTVGVALDNGVQVFFNGVDISGGIKIHNDCAGPDNFVFNVPDNVLRTGDNVLAVRGNWQSSKNYLDVRVTGDVFYTILASAEGNGTISPNGIVNVPAGTSQRFVFAPAVGHHVDSVFV